MTTDQTPATIHVADSLLAEIAKTTSIDIDNNIVSVAVQHNLAYRMMLENTRQTGKSEADAEEEVMEKFESLFCDMTSNQIIVLWTFTALQESKPEAAEKLLQVAVSIAKQLVDGTWQGSKLDSDMLRRLSVDNGGLTGEENAEALLQQLSSDVLTVKLGLDMLPNLLSKGNVHAQTLPSQAYNAQATVKHARRFVAIYEMLSSGSVTTSRVSIKIPATIPGLQAMRFLSSAGKLNEFKLGEGMPEGPIKVLGTAVFAVEQGVASAQAAGASFVSPYINSLAGHFYAVEEQTAESSERIASVSKRSIPEIVVPLQRCLLRLRKEHSDIDTQMKCASFLDPREAVDLCGLDQFTMGASVIDALANTAMTSELAASLQKARDQMQPASDEEMSKYGATQASQDDKEAGFGGWLKEGSASFKQLDGMLKNDERCRFMLSDALARFTSAEQQLRQLFSDL